MFTNVLFLIRQSHLTSSHFPSRSGVPCRASETAVGDLFSEFCCTASAMNLNLTKDTSNITHVFLLLLLLLLISLFHWPNQQCGLPLSHSNIEDPSQQGLPYPQWNSPMTLHWYKSLLTSTAWLSCKSTALRHEMPSLRKPSTASYRPLPWLSATTRSEWPF